MSIYKHKGFLIVMAQRIVQQYGIKYPFTSESNNGYYVDTNLDIKSKIRSMLMHIVFTPKGQKIRDPNFGTNLIKYIFEPNETNTWDNISEELNNAISEFLPNVSIDNIDMLQGEENPYEIYVKISYSIDDGSSVIKDSIVTNI